VLTNGSDHTENNATPIFLAMRTATMCVVALAALALVGSASADSSERASCIGALVSSASPGQSEFPPGFTAETTRFLHELAKAAGIPPGQTDAAIASFHGSAALCLELFG
jgi:hypothetical protein